MRGLVGKRFQYLDISWRLAEVMGQEDALVLVRTDGKETPLQASQYGHSVRRVPQTLTLPLSDVAGEGYSDEVLELLSGMLTDN